MRRAFWVAGSAFVVLLIVGAVGVQYAVDNILPYSPIRPFRCTPQVMAASQPNLLSPAAISSHWEDLDITVEDSIRLKGWFVHAEGRPARGTILLLHGIGSTRIAMLQEASFWTRNGYNCLLYDSRAQGESGGLNCTFGYFEKHDVSRYIDSTLARYPGSGPFGIIGDSFGAAVTIQALALDRRLVCGIARSPFATMRETMHGYFRQMFHVPLDFIPDAALKRSERIAHFHVDEVRPVDDARAIIQPTMIVHGTADEKIPFDNGKRIADNLAGPVSIWYPIPGVGHDNLGALAGPDYQRRLLEFMERYLVPAPSSR